MVWCSPLFKNFPHFIVIHIVKGFNVVSRAEVDFFSFFGIPLLFYKPMEVGNLIYGFSAFSKSNQLVHLKVFSSCTVEA